MLGKTKEASNYIKILTHSPSRKINFAKKLHNLIRREYFFNLLKSIRKLTKYQMRRFSVFNINITDKVKYLIGR